MVDDYSELKRAMRNSVTFLDKGRPFPVSPTPLLVPQSQYEDICANARRVLSALEKAVRIVSSDDQLWRHFPELHGLEDFVRLPNSTSSMIDLARFDLAVLKGGGVKMLEANAGCPGGLTTVGDINAAFAASTFFETNIADLNVGLAVDNKFYFVDFLASLVDANELVSMAFISSRHRRIVTDLDRLTELARERGYQVVRCDVQDLAYDGKRLTHEGMPINVAYLKFDAVVTEVGGMDLGIYGPDDDTTQPFIRAVFDRAFKYVSSFASQLLAENKRLLAMLSIDQVQNQLTNEEVSAVNQLVAKTYSLSSVGLDQFGGRERLRREKSQWVLKEVVESRGRGVHIGRHTTEEEWDVLVNSPAIHRFVAQEVVDLDIQEVLNPVFDEPGRFNAYTDMGLYMLGGEPIGFICRASRDPVVNVGKSGALRPTYVARDRTKLPLAASITSAGLPSPVLSGEVT